MAEKQGGRPLRYEGPPPHTHTPEKGRWQGERNECIYTQNISKMAGKNDNRKSPKQNPNKQRRKEKQIN